jgi:hypothetical protein
MGCNRVEDGTDVEFISVEVAFGWYQPWIKDIGGLNERSEACGRGLERVYTERDEPTFVSAGSVPSFSTLAPYGSPNCYAGLIRKCGICTSSD